MLDKPKPTGDRKTYVYATSRNFYFFVLLLFIFSILTSLWDEIFFSIRNDFTRFFFLSVFIFVGITNCKCRSSLRYKIKKGLSLKESEWWTRSICVQTKALWPSLFSLCNCEINTLLSSSTLKWIYPFSKTRLLLHLLFGI